jgi:type I restriction enzyme S subunit
MKFSSIPKTINYKDLIEHKVNSFSPTDYLNIRVKSKFEYLENLIYTPIYGKEVGTSNYMENSKLKFIRTKCLQDTAILLNLDDAIGLNPKEFRNFNLKEGNVLLVKDSNIGEICYLHEDLPTCAISGGIVKLNINDKLDKFYVIGIMKSSFFKEQIDLMTPKGATIRHSKDNFKYTKIPIPNDITIINKISVLTQSLIKKEIELRNKFDQINILIENELKENQLSNKFNYQMLSFNDLVELNRFDTGLYTQKIKEVEFLIKNYKHGSQTIVEQGFYSVRGQNLAVSVIGKSIYSNNYKRNFYQLFLPTHITKFGTVNKIIYFGNIRKLIPLKNEDIIFGAEGFEKGRSFILLNYQGKLTTNYHGTILRHDNKDIHKKIFIKCMLDWFREKNLIDAYSVGGNGGSFSTKYWKILKFPLFSEDKQKDIAKLYYNPSDDYLTHMVDFDIKNYINTDKKVTENSGILDLDKQIKTIRDIIDIEIKKMVG